jgi:hypothetical protein
MGKAARELIVDRYSFMPIGRRLCADIDPAALSGPESLLRADRGNENNDVGSTEGR